VIALLSAVQLADTLPIASVRMTMLLSVNEALDVTWMICVCRIEEHSQRHHHPCTSDWTKEGQLQFHLGAKKSVLQQW